MSHFNSITENIELNVLSSHSWIEGNLTSLMYHVTSSNTYSAPNPLSIIFSPLDVSHTIGKAVPFPFLLIHRFFSSNQQKIPHSSY